jgi:hypothetical protein
MVSRGKARTGCLGGALALLLIFGAVPLNEASAQTDTVTVVGDTLLDGGNLNNAVTAATRAGKLSTTVFKLEPGGRYILNDTIIVPFGNRLTIVAPEPGSTQALSPPQILWSSSTHVDTYISFDCHGDIYLKNVWLLYATTNGNYTGTSLVIEDAPDTVKGQVADFNGVVFDLSSVPWDASGAVDIMAKHFKGNFKNCYFRNCADQHFRYYGRAVSFPFMSEGWHTDSLTFEHCTFANIGSVLMQELGEYATFARFNHCTFLNTVLYPFESGWWHWFAVTNSVFVNAYMYGDIPAERYQYGGALLIDSISAFGFSVPFREADRHILFANSSYCVEDWLRRHMANNPNPYQTGDVYDPRPQPMLSEKTITFFNNKNVWPYVSMARLYDSTNPGFTLPPTDTTAIKTYLFHKWFDCADTVWAFEPFRDLNGEWPMKEDLSYSNPTLLNAGMGGFPLGDLYHWFPSQYSRWQRQEHGEASRISTWLATGTDPLGAEDVENGPAWSKQISYVLFQNYPNPFNPTTVVSCQLPVASKVKLVVYDLLGREIAVLLDDYLSPGTYRVKFDGTGLASGVYCYRLTAGEYVAAKRMALVK